MLIIINHCGDHPKQARMRESHTSGENHYDDHDDRDNHYDYDHQSL